MPSQIIGSKGQRVYEAADGAAAGAGGGGAAIAITDNRTSGGAGYATVSSGTVVLAGGNNITLSQDGSSITISGGAGAGGLGAGMSTLGNTSGDTGFVTGRLIFAGLGAVTLSGSTNGASMSISMSAPAQTTQTQGIGSLGISGGNTAGDTGTATLGRLVFAGGSNVTLSGSSNGASRTISIAAADQTVQTQGIGSIGISGGNTAGDTGTQTLGRLVLAGGNNVTLSGSSNGASRTITISAASQTVQTQGGFAALGISGGNTAGDTGAATRDRLVFAGGNSITVSGSTNAGSMTITIVGPSAVAQSVQTQGIEGIGISGGNTAGDTGTATRARVVFAGHSNITLSGSTNGASLTISASVADQTVQTQGGFASIGISGGNTQGDTGAATRARVVFAGGNSITLSGSTNGASHTITIVGPSQSVQTQGGFASLGISGGNTAGDTGAATRDRLVFAGAGIITLSGSTNGGSHTISISAAAGAGFAGGGISGGNTAGDTGSVTGRLIFAGGNNVTLSGSTNGGSQTISIVGATLTNSSYSAGISGGNTAGDTGTQTGRLVFAGANSITLSGSSSNNGNQTISIVGPTITQSSYSAGISGGNTAGDTGTQTGRLVLAGGANITLSGSSSNNGNQTITIVGPAPGGGFAGGGISGGNTAGDTGSVTGRLIFAGGAAITLSGSTNGGSQTISIVGSAQSVQTQGIPILGISGGNTAGDTGANSGTKLVFAGGANITLSGATAANATTISVVGGAGGGAMTGALSNIGNTSGDTGAQGLSRLVFAGGDNVTLSGSTAANSQTITIMGQPYRRMWNNFANDQTSQAPLTNSTSIMNPVILPYPVQVDFARFYFNAATNTGATFATTANSTITAEARQTLRVDFFTRGTGANSMSLQNITSGSAGLTEQWSLAEGANSAAMSASYRVTYPLRSGSSSFSTSTVVSSASWNLSAFSSVWHSRASGLMMMDVPFAGGNASINEGPLWVLFGISTAQATQVANATAAANNSLSFALVMQNSPMTGGVIHRPWEVTASSIQPFPAMGNFSTVGGATTASIPISAVSSKLKFPIAVMAFMADIDA
jgi:hypothetical protein